jgi:hypothetical protein
MDTSFRQEWEQHEKSLNPTKLQLDATHPSSVGTEKLVANTPNQLSLTVQTI